jgi:hypothetical protein
MAAAVAVAVIVVTAVAVALAASSAWQLRLELSGCVKNRHSGSDYGSVRGIFNGGCIGSDKCQ